MMSSVKQKYERRGSPRSSVTRAPRGRARWSAPMATPPATAWCSSFTLPPAARQARRGRRAQLAKKMGMEPAMLVHAKAMGSGFTFFVVYGAVSHVVDLRQVKVVEREFPLLRLKEVNTGIRDTPKRRLVVVGACIGTDAHTVGIDAILNIKGLRGEKGLEYYSEIKVVNLGAQVPCPTSSLAPRPSRPTRSWSARSSPRRTPTCTMSPRCRRPSERPTRPAGCRCSSSADPASRTTRAERPGSTGSSGGAPPERGRQPSRPRGADQGHPQAPGQEG